MSNVIINRLKKSKKCAIKVEAQDGGTATYTFNTEGLELSALGEAAVAYTSEITKITAPVQDNLSEAQREPIFSEMAAIVKGDTSTKDAVEAVLELVKEDE